MNYAFKMLDGEYWWGGTSTDGRICPMNKDTLIERDFRKLALNQTMPMYLSNLGRCIWSDKPFSVRISAGIFFIEGEDVTIETFGNSLREAYLGAMQKHFPPMGDKLPDDFFKKPQYNTWMQFTYNQTQKGVLQYAEDIIKNGFEPGILIIDEGWQKEYGTWQFDPQKFENPKEMVQRLHALGFKVLLWVTPHVSPNGEMYIRQVDKRFNPKDFDKMFLRNREGQVAVCMWWNGYSAMLDFTKECDCAFLDTQLQTLMSEYGIDGFKFDGGKLSEYENCINGLASDEATAAERNMAWNAFGRRYAFHEYKDTFRGGGIRSIQRICDRQHAWDDEGLNTLIPYAILQGLLGHPYICPDMIGGGSWVHRALGNAIDEELFVRMAQCSAFFPMMQFSWAPWEAVGQENLCRIRNAEKLHIEKANFIAERIEEAYQTGEPILRNLEYNFPHMGYHEVRDVFMLGEKILVAPVVIKGAEKREVPLPPGLWCDAEGKTFTGGQTVTIPVTLDTLPYFIRKQTA